jgi:phosphoglycerol transferase MdoB-like AlkP superfamily enzyme
MQENNNTEQNKTTVKRRPLRKAGGFVARGYRKVNGKFRERFPKKEPKLYDADLHQSKFILRIAALSFLVYLYIETFARATDGLLQGVLFMVHHPLIFVYNWLIIFTMACLTLLFKKRGFVLTLILLFWVALGTVNGAILIKRMTPFTLYDIQNLGDGLTLATTYYSKAQIILVVLAIAVLLAIVVLYFFSCYKWKNVNLIKSLVTIALSGALCIGFTAGLLRTGGISTFFGNLNYAYEEYGFPYGFINTSLNTGISKPGDYSQSSIENLLKEHTQNGTNQILENVDDDLDHPNIIVLQMESFTIAQDYNHISVDRDPTPVFTDLMNNYTTGWFEVPACGAGTANTEFEVLTGISARFFGPGEYPYKGRLREQTLESMAYVLKSRGYRTSALHNHRALFYNRNEVYANLGFDSYTSIEYMNNMTKTPTGWAKDEILTDEIMNIMETTDERDFMHVISVEGHGAYPTEQVFKNPYTVVTADDEDTKWKYEYYLNECHEMDTFIGDLISEIEASGEPTVMIIYGDHIPALDVKESEYGTGNLYETRYVIWDNIGLEKEDKDITSYQAGSELLSKSGYGHLGAIFDFQQTTDRKDKEYLDGLKALAYDMIYGENYTFGGKDPFKPVKMTMGFREIKVDDIVKIGDSYYITGSNFTEHSSVSLDGKVLKTTYLSPTLLALQDKVDPEDIDKLQVSQIDTKDDTILTTIDALEEL